MNDAPGRTISRNRGFNLEHAGQLAQDIYCRGGKVINPLGSLRSVAFCGVGILALLLNLLAEVGNAFSDCREVCGLLVGIPIGLFLSLRSAASHGEDGKQRRHQQDEDRSGEDNSPPCAA